jgi:hypothetical protein
LRGPRLRNWVHQGTQLNETHSYHIANHLRILIVTALAYACKLCVQYAPVSKLQAHHHCRSGPCQARCIVSRCTQSRLTTTTAEAHDAASPAGLAASCRCGLSSSCQPRACNLHLCASPQPLVQCPEWVPVAVRTSPVFEKVPTRHKHKVAHAAVRPGGLTAHCVQSTPVCKSTITWCWYSATRCSSGCQSSAARAPGETRQGSHCWAVAKKERKKPQPNAVAGTRCSSSGRERCL